MRLKQFENFSEYSSVDFAISILDKLDFESEDLYEYAQKLCVKGESSDRTTIVYIFPDHPDKELASYNINIYINGVKSEDNTKDLEESLRNFLKL